MARGLGAKLARDRLPDGDPGRKRFDRVLANTRERMEGEFDYYPETCTQTLFDWEQPEFARGFIDAAVVQDYVVELFAEAVFDLTLVRDLTIDDETTSDYGDRAVDGLLRGLPRASRALKVLHVASAMRTVGAAERLFACPHLAGLEELSVCLPPEADRAALAVAACPYLRGLRRLWLDSDENFSDDALAALLDSPHLAGLEELTFRSQEVPFGAAVRRRYEERFGRPLGP